MRWFTSDTHFGHQNIMKFEPESRPFSSTEEMDEVLIERWNSVVKPRDIVYHLGDAIMGDFRAGVEKMQRLNGQLILVPGNHDRVFSGLKPNYIQKWRPEYLKVFEVIDREQEFTNLDHRRDLRVLMCHFPYEGDSHGEDRYSEMRPVDNGLPLLHGHVHGQWKFNGRQFNVGVDVNNLTPVSEDEIIAWIATL